MTRRLRISIQPDGTIVAETQGVSGPDCLDELERIRVFTGGTIESSKLTNDFFTSQSSTSRENQSLEAVNEPGE